MIGFQRNVQFIHLGDFDCHLYATLIKSFIELFRQDYNSIGDFNNFEIDVFGEKPLSLSCFFKISAFNLDLFHIFPEKGCT